MLQEKMAFFIGEKEAAFRPRPILRTSPREWLRKAK